MKNFFLIVVLAALFPISALGSQDPNQHLTLAQAQSIALANHPAAKVSTYETIAAGEDVAIVRSILFPQVQGAAVGAVAQDEDTRLAAIGAINNPTIIQRGSGGVTISQLITDFGRTNAMIAAARASLKAQYQRENLTREQVLLGVTRAYYDVLRANALLKVANRTLKTRQTVLDQINALRKAQLRSDLDYDMAKANVDDAKLLLFQAENGWDDARAELSDALGYGQTYLFTLEDTSRATPPARNLDTALSLAFCENPVLKALQAQSQAAQKMESAARKEFFPTIVALGAGGGSPYTTSGLSSTYAAGALNLTIPIFTGGRISADVDKAAAMAEAASMRVAVEKNELVRDVHMAYHNMRNAYKNIAVTQSMHKRSKDALVLIQARYDIGKSSIVDLSLAQLADTKAAVAEADAAYRYFINRAVLDFTIGDLACSAQKL
ncbi:MAG: TolC family protein [Syntrophobacteraceae bacterium]